MSTHITSQKSKHRNDRCKMQRIRHSKLNFQQCYDMATSQILNFNFEVPASISSKHRLSNKFTILWPTSKFLTENTICVLCKRHWESWQYLYRNKSIGKLNFNRLKFGEIFLFCVVKHVCLYTVCFSCLRVGMLNICIFRWFMEINQLKYD